MAESACWDPPERGPDNHRLLQGRGRGETAVMQQATSTYGLIPVADEVAQDARTYTLCFFGAGFVVPQVQLIEACSDAEAIDHARSTRQFTRREIWDRHRLVAVMPASAEGY